MRSLRSTGVLLAGVVVVTTAARLAGARGHAVPWIAPDEMLYALLGTSLWSDGSLEIRGLAAPYYSLLTPALLGVAFLGRETSDGVAIAQALQVAAMASAAVPTYLWARRLASPGWALGAATVSVAGPLLTYGGLLMTEALIYPASTWALLACARALERPTVARQGVFLLAVTVAASVRMQALVLLAVYAGGALALAWLSRDRSSLRAAAPLALGVVATLIAVAAIRVVRPGALDSAELLGGYATLGTTTSFRGSLVESFVTSVGVVAIVTAFAPALATGLLAIATARRRDAPRVTQAFVAVAVTYTLVLTAQVALFAEDRLGHVSQRYLLTIAPVFAVGLAAWVGAGAPRPRAASLAAGTGLIVLVALVPRDELAPQTGLQDTIGTSILRHLDDDHVRPALVATSLLAAGLVVLVPRRFLVVSLGVLIGGLAVSSVDASRAVRELSRAEDLAARGTSPRDWLDRQADGPVTLLVTGERGWPVESRTFFWNESVRQVLALAEVGGGVPPGPTVVTIDPDEGWVKTTDGQARLDRLVAAPGTLVLDGEQVAVMPYTGGSSVGLVLWRAATPVRVAAQTAGFLPNGDFSGTAELTVFGCGPGRLEVVLLGKSGDPVDVRVNGVATARISVPAGTVTTASIPAPGYVDGRHRCSFALETDGYVGSTRVAYVADGEASA